MEQPRPSKKKKYIVIGALAGLIGIFGLAGDHQNQKLYVQETNHQAQTVPAASTPTTSPSLSNNNYYTNSSGNEVHSPASTSDNSIPAGASARCGDGTYSFSQHRSGTCSHHGGVAEWL